MILTLLLQFAFAQQPLATPSIEPLPHKVEAEKPDFDYKYYAIATYSPFDLMIPHKYGLTAGLFETGPKNRTWEFEYLRGGVSHPFLVKHLGSMTDQKFSILARSYPKQGSFNISYGITYFDFSLHLSDAILNRVTGGNIPSIDVLQMQSFGFNVGLGNRWTYKNMIFGVDWVNFAQPLFITNEQSIFMDYATDPKDRERVNDLIREISYIPRISVLKLQFGLMF